MRKHLQLLLVIALAVGLTPNVALAAKTPPPPPPLPVFAGSVTSDAGVALAGAKVEVFTYTSRTKTWGPTAKYSAVTDASGRFSLQIPAANYRLRFSHPAFLAEYYEEKTTLATGTTFVLGTAGATLNESLAPVFQDGSQAAPFLVYDVASLNDVRNHPNCYFKQLTDIDISGGWLPIGSSEQPIDGINYDGQNHLVRGLYARQYGSAGLFGRITNSTISNLRLYGAVVETNQGGGGMLVGAGSASTLRNCFVSGSVKDYDTSSWGWGVGGLAGDFEGLVESCSASVSVGPIMYYTGGLVGRMVGTVRDSAVTGDLFGVNYCGGLIGISGATTVERSWTNVSVNGDDFNGGLIGCMDSPTVVTDCAARGNVVGRHGQTGGLVGWNRLAGSSISRSYSSGAVSGVIDVGGTIGYSAPVVVDATYYDAQVAPVADNGYGTPKTTAEMQDVATYAGWDFTTVWNAPVAGASYPTLR